MHFSAAVAAFLPILAVSAADIKILVGDGGVRIYILWSNQRVIQL
jgi:hypothetical protein